MPASDVDGEYERRLRLDDGRSVTFLDMGKPDGIPVFGLHGTPGSRFKFRGAHATAMALGIRLIALDRWGYGGSDAPSHASLDAYAFDLSACADAVGVDRFGLIGVSGGGPYAAIAAHCLRARVTRVGLVSPVGPMIGTGRRQAGLFHRLSFRVAPRIPGAMRATFEVYRLMARHMPMATVALAMARAPAADHAIMSDTKLRSAMARSFAVGLSRSTRGAVIDMELFSRDWRAMPLGPDVARLWVGTDDGNVPVNAARTLARMTNAYLVEIERGGHYWMETAWNEVLGWAAALDP